MPSSTIQSRVVSVEHLSIESVKTFAEVRAALEALLPRLSGDIARLVEAGDTQLLEQKLEQEPELSIFYSRDHGRLLQIAGLSRNAIQYDIGNPLTASKMTRHRLPAGLYVPLRVILYETDAGGVFFEYDKPSSLLGQFDEEHVAEIARGLDVALERSLIAAAG